MWTRKELKDAAKIRFKANYWKCVLTSLIFMVVCGGGSITYSNKGNISKQNGSISYNISPFNSNNTASSNLDTGTLALLAGVSAIFIFIIIVVAVILLIFLFNPLQVGCQKFFTRNLHEDASLNHIGFAFSKDYMNIIKVMFFRNLFIFLWSLLFIIPGIIKSYEYRMIPYILGESPSIDSTSAFAMSKDMMTGNKWKAFVLDLSFILWILLCVITLNIVGIFYVNPYVNQTNACLYETLKKNISIPAQAQY